MYDLNYIKYLNISEVIKYYHKDISRQDLKTLTRCIITIYGLDATDDQIKNA